jgi:hypothetical protein
VVPQDLLTRRLLAHEVVFAHELVARFGHIGPESDGLERKDDFVRKVVASERDISGATRRLVAQRDDWWGVEPVAFWGYWFLGAGTSRRWRSGEKKTRRPASQPPATPIQIVGRMPTVPAVTPSRPPSGRVPGVRRVV